MEHQRDTLRFNKLMQQSPRNLVSKAGSIAICFATDQRILIVLRTQRWPICGRQIAPSDSVVGFAPTCAYFPPYKSEMVPPVVPSLCANCLRYVVVDYRTPLK